MGSHTPHGRTPRRIRTDCSSHPEGINVFEAALGTVSTGDAAAERPHYFYNYGIQDPGIPPDHIVHSTLGSSRQFTPNYTKIEPGNQNYQRRILPEVLSRNHETSFQGRRPGWSVRFLVFRCSCDEIACQNPGLTNPRVRLTAQRWIHVA